MDQNMMHRNATNCTPMHISHAASHRQHFWMRHSGWQLTYSSWWSTDKAGNGQQMVVNRPTAGGWLVMAGRRRGGDLKGNPCVCGCHNSKSETLSPTLCLPGRQPVGPLVTLLNQPRNRET